MVVIIDNYDSFTYSIVQYLYELKAEVMIFRNDEVSISDISDLSPDRLVVSPGPGTPKNAGILGEHNIHFAFTMDGLKKKSDFRQNLIKNRSKYV